MLHGREAAEAAADTARRTFEEGATGGDLPTLQVPEGSISIVLALTGLGFAASNGEARRKIGEGAVKLNGETVSDPDFFSPFARSATFPWKSHAAWFYSQMVRARQTAWNRMAGAKPL